MTPAKSPLYVQIMIEVAEWRRKGAAFLTGLSFWPDLLRMSMMVSGPVTAIARWTLAAMPSLRRAEWLLEIETLTKRHPVALAFSICFTAWRGLMPTSLGHIGTDTTIYPFLGAVSGFNPFLGLLCGAAYGVGDLVQKLLWNDIYQSPNTPAGRLSMNYWGAMLGYVLAYSSTMTMGVLPGFTSRLSRLAMRTTMRAVMFHRVAAGADGALPPGVVPPGALPFQFNFKDPKFRDALQQLQQDPRNLLADPNAWRSMEDLTPYQRLILSQLHAQRYLGPEGQKALQNLLAGDASTQATEPPAEPDDPQTLAQGPTPVDPTRCATAEGAYPLPEMLAGIFGGAVGGALTMYALAPTLEGGAFEFRPNPDDGCRKLEIDTYLHGKAPMGGLGGAVGGLGPNITPPPQPPGGSGPPPIINPFSGKPLTAWNPNSPPDEYGNPGEAGQVMWQGHWVDPTDAKQGIQASLDADTRRAAEEDSRAAQNAQDIITATQAMGQRDQAAADAEAAHNQALIDRYNQLVNAATSGNLNSAAGLSSLDYWHGQVVRSDGSINPAALQLMQQSLIGDKQDLLQQQIDQNSAIAEAEGHVASAWNAATTAAQYTRDGAFLIDGVLLTGGASAAVGGGVAGHVAAGVAGTYWGGLTSGITAMSDKGSMDAASFEAGAAGGLLSGAVVSIAGSVLGAAANAAGMNPYVAGALIGGTISKAGGGSFLQGAVLGTALMPLSNIAGNAVNSGGWNAPVDFSATGASHVNPLPEASPAQAPPVDRSRPTVFTSDRGQGWGQNPVPPPKAGAAGTLGGLPASGGNQPGYLVGGGEYTPPSAFPNEPRPSGWVGPGDQPSPVIPARDQFGGGRPATEPVPDPFAPAAATEAQSAGGQPSFERGGQGTNAHVTEFNPEGLGPRPEWTEPRNPLTPDDVNQGQLPLSGKVNPEQGQGWSDWPAPGDSPRTPRPVPDDWDINPNLQGKLPKDTAGWASDENLKPRPPQPFDVPEGTSPVRPPSTEPPQPIVEPETPAPTSEPPGSPAGDGSVEPGGTPQGEPVLASGGEDSGSNPPGGGPPEDGPPPDSSTPPSSAAPDAAIPNPQTPDELMHNIQRDIDNLKSRLAADYPPPYTDDPGAQTLSDEITARQNALKSVDPRTADRYAVMDYLKQNPSELDQYYINMDASRLADAIQVGRLNPGTADIVYSTGSGSGPGDYSFDNTRIVRVDPGDVVELRAMTNGRYQDTNGKIVKLADFPDKIIAIPGGNGVDRQLTYVTPDGQIQTGIPKDKLQVWSKTAGGFRPLP